MTSLRFDPSKAVTFDLAHGLVHLTGAPSRVLVPAEALGALAHAAGPEATAGFGRALGEVMGRRVAASLTAAEGIEAASTATVVEHLGGELALAGLGSLGLERWGKAMVLVMDHSPLAGTGDALLEATLAAAIAAASGRPVRALLLGRETVRARFLIGGEAALARARAWLGEGVSWGEVLVRLHAPSTEGGEA